MVTLTMRSRWARTAVLAAGVLLAACPGGRRTPETSGSARLKDSAPEKIAATRAATPGLKLEDEDARWGITAAQERRRARDEDRRKAASMTDIRATPTVEVAPLPAPPRGTP